MAHGNIELIAASCAGIGCAIWLIAKLGLHPFLGLLTGAIVVALLAGMGPHETLTATTKGFADIMGGTGIIVALGLGLGAILNVTGAAGSLAGWLFARFGRFPILGSLIAAVILGLPLFFETGVVLLLPVIAAAVGNDEERRVLRLRCMLSALCGLSVLHALLPPHPGPLIAVAALHARLDKTFLIGLLVAIPTALLAGPLLSRFTTRGIGDVAAAAIEAPSVDAGQAPPSPFIALAALLFPIALITLGAIDRLIPGVDNNGATRWLTLVTDPVVAMLAANLLALVLLCGRRIWDRELQDQIWSGAMRPAGSVLLSIGGGGALKQVLVTCGLPDIFVQLARSGSMSPLLTAWLVSAAIRVATGSATVATITASGVMAGVAATGAASPEYMVLAIGAGSVFLSHVNDPGFWLVKNYLGTSTAQTIRVWTSLETLLSLAGLAFVLTIHAIFSFSV